MQSGKKKKFYLQIFATSFEQLWEFY